MKENKNTCPICFTKMQPMNHSLVCPECGYRYCDHSYENRDMYSTDHTHTPNYTTTQTANRQGVNSVPQNPSGTPAAGQRNTSVPGDNEIKKVKNIIRIIVLIYFAVVFLSAIVPMLLHLFY